MCDLCHASTEADAPARLAAIGKALETATGKEKDHLLALVDALLGDAAEAEDPELGLAWETQHRLV